jgi:hypothetical protein
MHFEAIFNPKNVNAYSQLAGQFIGKKIAVQNGWQIEEGPHKGQFGYYVPSSHLGVIPQSDLSDIKSIPYVQWRELHDHTITAE